MAGRRRSYSRKTGRKTYVLGTFGNQENFYLEERKRRSAYGKRSRKDEFEKLEKQRNGRKRSKRRDYAERISGRSGYGSILDRQQGRSRARRKGSGRKWLVAVAGLLLLLLIGGGLTTWFSYQGRVYKKCVFEAGVEIQAEDFLKKEGKKIQFAKDSKPVDIHVPGEYPVKLKSGYFTYTCIAFVQDTIPPTAETVAVYCEEGQRVEAEAFVKNIQDETNVTVEYVQEPDFNYFGVQPVEIALTDAGNNQVVLSSQMITQVAAVELTLEAGAPFPPLSEFMKNEVEGAAFLTDIQTIDTKKPGDYPIEIQAGGITYTTQLHIRDTVAPVVEVQNLTVYNSEKVVCETFITKAEDVTALTYAFEKEPDLTLIGEQPLVLVVTDEGGNVVKKELVLTVLEDTGLPVIEGAVDIWAYLGSNIRYKDGVTVKDDHDKDVQLEVDTSGVNTQACGDYPLLYIATDGAGNQATVSVTVHIVERNVSEAEMYRMADEVLAEITYSGMGPLQKMREIYRWTHDSIDYVGSSEKSDWVSAACEGFSLRRGDCYTYACVAKALLNRAGIENKDIEKVPGNMRHYWNLVNIGEGWYHFDATPRPDQDLDLCYITDAVLAEYGVAHGSGLNRYDRNVYTDIQ